MTGAALLECPPSPLILSHQGRGVASSDLGRAEGRSPSKMGRNPKSEILRGCRDSSLPRVWGCPPSYELSAISSWLTVSGGWRVWRPWVTARLADQFGELTRTTCNEIDSICVAMLESG